VDRAGLRTEISGFLGETYLGAGGEILKPTSEHAVPMEVDEPPIIGFDSTISVFSIELADPPLCGPDVSLNIEPPSAFVVFKLAPRRAERVPQRDVWGFVSMIGRMSPANGDLFIRHGDIDPEIV